MMRGMSFTSITKKLCLVIWRVTCGRGVRGGGGERIDRLLGKIKTSLKTQLVGKYLRGRSVLFSKRRQPKL